MFGFYFFVISHPQPMQVASRNSPWAARGRGKRNPKIRKIPKIHQIANFSKSQYLLTLGPTVMISSDIVLTFENKMLGCGYTH